MDRLPEPPPMADEPRDGLDVAIVGMAGRFPGAGTVTELWRNLVAGVESIVELDEAWLRAQGASAAQLADPAWIRVGAPLADADAFDAEFFGYSPREAEILDPQQRVFLECAWHALEDAGIDPTRSPYSGIGVFAGAGMNGYLLNLYADAATRAAVTPYELFVANDKDFLTTRVSYKLGLRGPSVSVQTACSSSLVAVHLACQSLIAGECDVALAGGVAISRQIGYRAQEGGIQSADGHCRAFDAAASGTVGGNGVGIVVLKRLAEALEDGDDVVAVIRGSAINNDGAAKVSYTAPSVDAQAAVIRAALEVAGVPAQDIGYVEAHGTGTRLGDPIEVAALTQAYAAEPGTVPVPGRCALGSVKTNIGHLDAAAGVAGLIKAALVVRDGRIPASLHFRTPNPVIDFAATPFRVNAETSAWHETPRRAGVSSFGIGGTNAHVILEQAPAWTLPATDSRPQVLLLSARTPAALDLVRQRLAAHLEAHPSLALADVAHTLQRGRRALELRHAIVAADVSAAVEQLRAPQAAAVVRAAQGASLVWLFPGQGSQFPGMARAFYAEHAAFREALERCAARLDKTLGLSLTALLCEPPMDAAVGLLDETRYTQPALFAFEYALAALWRATGLRPRALLGHSLGEYVAACVAGVFDLDTALDLVALRARLMQSMPRGAMLAIMAAEEALRGWLDADVVLAAVNAPGMVVVAGPTDRIDRLELRARAEGMHCQRLRTSHAFHSQMMAAAAAELASALRGVRLRAPDIPFVSNLTGDWIRAEQATDPGYWAQQMLSPVRFSDCVRTLASLHEPVLLEVGPGTTLATLAQQSLPNGAVPRAVCSLPSAAASLPWQHALGQLWCHGVTADGSTVPAGRRVALPGYPFQRRRFWVGGSLPADPQQPAGAVTGAAIDSVDPADWCYVPGWRSAPLAGLLPVTDTRRTWLLLLDQGGTGRRLARLIEETGFNVFTVIAGTAFGQRDYREFALDPARARDYEVLRAELEARALPADVIVDLRSLDASADANTRFREVLALAQGWADCATALRIALVTRAACDVLGQEACDCDQAVIHGMAQVIGQEYPHLAGRVIDVSGDAGTDVAVPLWSDLRDERAPALTAWRRNRRWQMTFERLRLPPLPPALPRHIHGVRRDGCYAVVGDLKRGLGTIWVRGLIEAGVRRLVLVSAAEPAAPVTDALLNECSAADIEVVALHAEAAHAGEALAQALAGGVGGVLLSLPTANERSAAPLALMGTLQWDYNCRTRKALLHALAAACERHPPAWCCVQGSMSSVLGGIGLAAYASANHYVDAYVQQQASRGPTAWYAIDWDPIAADTPQDSRDGRAGAVLREHALAPGDAWTLTLRILALTQPGRSALSRTDLESRRRLQAQPAAADEAPSQARGAPHERPPLATEYVAPRTEVEEAIAKVWQELLRIDRIGVHDSFFDLGGHSLLAIQVIGRLRQAFPVRLELRELLDGTPTVAGIAAVIAPQLPDADQMDRMAALLAEVQSMSGEDVAARLAPQGQP